MSGAGITALETRVVLFEGEQQVWAVAKGSLTSGLCGWQLFLVLPRRGSAGKKMKERLSRVLVSQSSESLPSWSCWTVKGSDWEMAQSLKADPRIQPQECPVSVWNSMWVRLVP